MPACRRPAKATFEYDVCIVGSGPGGAVLACELARQGLRILLLEGGPASAIAKVRPVQTYPMSHTDPIDYPIERTRFQGDGGTSNLWGGECPRFQPIDFEAGNPYAPPDAHWPISYADIEGFYQRAERELSIEGGEQSPFSAPRNEDFPFPITAENAATCLRELLASVKWSADPIPRSRLPRIAQSHLPRLANYPAAVFWRNMRVTEILTSDGRVAGLRSWGADGVETTIRARFYVLACGGIETPRLLLASSSVHYPNGIGNGYGQVGRHFMEHLSVEIGTYRLKSPPLCAGEDYEDAISWQLSAELKARGLGNAVLNFGLSRKDSTLAIGAVLEMKPVPANRVGLSETDKDNYGAPVATVRVAIADEDRQTWEHVKNTGHRIASSLGGQLTDGGSDLFRWCHHHMGTCRMGSDSRTSVVNTNLRVHGLDNLYVAGSAVFVTGGAGSPTLLLTGLTLRLADHLVSRVRSA